MREDGSLDGKEFHQPLLVFRPDWTRQQFAMVGEASGDILTYAGFTLVHENPAELEFLFPKGVKKIIPLPPSVRRDQTMPVRMHPEINGVIEFPIRKKDFKR